MVRRSRLDKAAILNAAGTLTEEVGLNNLTLKLLSARLGVKTPSLYNHVSGLQELLDGLSALGIRRLGEAIANAAIGRSGSDALRAVAIAYRRFAKENPELYKAILKYPEIRNAEISEAKSVITRILKQVMLAYNFCDEDLFHMMRAMHSMIHGFISLEEAGFFKSKYDVDVSYQKVIEYCLQYIRQYEKSGV